MSFWRFFKFGQSAALTNRYGRQITAPIETIIETSRYTGVDGAMQIATVWRAVEIIAKTISTLPIMVYTSNSGVREVARDSSLWSLLHDRPNSRQTPAEFWTAMLLNMLLRGNGYAEISRNRNGEAFAVSILPADQIEVDIRQGGNDVYIYTNGEEIREIKAENVLHIKEMTGNYVGMSRLEYMRISLDESINAQKAANGLFSSNGRTNGVLSPSDPMTPAQWQQLQERVDELAKNPRQIQVLPGNLKLSTINLTPNDIQLLTTRQFTVQEIGRWFGVPAILLNQTEGSTTLGSSSGDIIESFHKLTIRPLVVSIEQSIRHRLMTAGQRIALDVEFNLDGLLRASPIDRMEIYAKAVQNGIYNRNEARQYENMAPFSGGDVYTAQSNLLPIDQLGLQPNPTQSQIMTVAQ